MWVLAPAAWRLSIAATPVVAGSTLLFGCFDKRFYALDSEWGQPRWALKSDGEIAAAALVLGNTAYFGSLDNCLYAVSLESGRPFGALALEDGSPPCRSASPG